MAGDPMRTAISTLGCRSPGSLEEALEAMQDGALTPIAGATDLYVALNFGTLSLRKFLDLSRIKSLRAIAMTGDTLVLGATASYSELIRSPEVNRRLPMLVSAAQQIGGIQIQNRGTLGGNIANAAPAGDSLPVLFAAEAIVVLRNRDRERKVPITKFYTGYRTSVRQPDELIVAVEVPPVAGRQWFRKVGTRAAQAISKVVLAGVHHPKIPRIALGSVGPTIIRAYRTEEALSRGENLEVAVRILQEEIAPIDDLRSTEAYRRTVAGNLLRQFWTG